MWALTMAVVFSATAAGSADTPVEVVNGGFEQVDAGGNALGWQVDQAGLQGGAAARPDTDAPHFGTRSLRIDSPAPGSAVVASNPVELRVGHLYRLSGWIRARGARSDPTSRYPTAVPACLSMESFPFTNHSPAVGGDTDWTQVESLFVATRSRDRVRLHLGHNGTASGKVWFDDVHLEVVDDVSEFIPMETVRWFRDGYRYDDRGWIFVHVEGAPYERGYQYGTLVADEIVQYISKLAIQGNAADPAAGWKALRFESDALFLRGYDQEYLTEMKGW